MVLTHMTFGGSLAPTTGPRPATDEHAVSVPHAAAPRERIQLADGVSLKISLRLGELSPREGYTEPVRCVAYMLLFLDANGVLLGTSFGERLYTESSEGTLTISTASIDPYLAAGTSAGNSVMYQVSLSPGMDQTWGEARASDVLHSVVPVD